MFILTRKGIPGDEYGLKLYDRLIAAPWNAEEHPEVAEWLQERNVVLDYFGHCVRKPNYVGWRQPSDEGIIYEMLLPEVQAQREFARDLRIRITYRLGLGDTEGAWYDIMSMLTLAKKHYKNDPILVTNLVGVLVERLGCDAAKILMKQGHPTREQLLRFSKELDALPSSHTYFNTWLTEQYMLFDALRLFNQNRKEKLHEYRSQDAQNVIEVFGQVMKKLGDEPVDQDIVKHRIQQRYEECKSEQITLEEILANRLFRRQYFENIDRRVHEVRAALEKQIRENTEEESRSQMFGDMGFAFFSPAFWALDTACSHGDSEFTLLKIAIALERYKLDHGDYPETLEALLFTYLEEVPLDPCTSRSTITYKKEGETFLFYSYGPNQQDDGGQAVPDTFDGDIVF